jgi:vancomycin resistance protein YoaR
MPKENDRIHGSTRRYRHRWRKNRARHDGGWNRQSPTSTLSLKTITPKITGEDAERLGITDLLGTGRSDFSGSPSNRRKNIALGKAKMNGVLIPPGENFSQLGVLGEIDGAHGWLPELVIKETRPFRNLAAACVRLVRPVSVQPLIPACRL